MFQQPEWKSFSGIGFILKTKQNLAKKDRTYYTLTNQHVKFGALLATLNFSKKSPMRFFH